MEDEITDNEVQMVEDWLMRTITSLGQQATMEIFARGVIQRMRRLQTVVDRLPKTADGVPVTFRMNVFYIDESKSVVGAGFLQIEHLGEEAGFVGILRDEHGREVETCPESVYSSREAALAAHGAGRAKS